MCSWSFKNPHGEGTVVVFLTGEQDGFLRFKPVDLSLIPGMHRVEGENRVPRAVIWQRHTRKIIN